MNNKNIFFKNTDLLEEIIANKNFFFRLELHFCL